MNVLLTISLILFMCSVSLTLFTQVKFNKLQSKTNSLQLEWNETQTKWNETQTKWNETQAQINKGIINTIDIIVKGDK